MFSKETYKSRREKMKENLGSGIVLFPGNDESPMNYPDNTYHFRQDSSFLYYWGLDFPGLSAIIDIDQDKEIVFGDDVDIQDIIWTGPRPSIADRARAVGVEHTEASKKFIDYIQDAVNKNRTVHFLPQYRAENILKISRAVQIPPEEVNKNVSEQLIKTVVAHRSIKSEEEIKEIEKAIDITYEMQKEAMRITKPGMYEYEVYGRVEGIALSHGSHPSFPIIYTIHGEILHGHSHENLMKEGNLAIMDCGAESPLHYAGDITRTYPVGGKFSQLQKDIYNVVLSALEKSVEMMKPDVFNRDCHLKAAATIFDGMKQLGFFKGNSEDGVREGVHTLFFPHGLGHMVGLDVHDMENLGEDYVGYDDEIKRSDKFGLNALRLGRRLKPGFVITAEPGLYFIPELIKRWKAENKFKEFINYDKIEKHIDFSGIRIEDDILITKDGHRVLGKKIAKTVEEIENWCSQ